MREGERAWMMRAGRKAREEGKREGGVGGLSCGEEEEKLEGGKGDDVAGKGREERQEGRKGGRAGRTDNQHLMTDVEDENEDEDEESGMKRMTAVLTFVMDSDERRKGLCKDLFQELMDFVQVRWAGRVMEGRKGGRRGR